MKYLFIAEKPSAAREYSAVYKKHKSEIDKAIGGDITFFVLRGHLYTYMEPKDYKGVWDKPWAELYSDCLPMVPQPWGMKPVATAKTIVKELKVELKKNYDGIIVGTDSDVEGYGIYYRIMVEHHLEKMPTLRFLEVSMTEKDILQSFLSMTDMMKDPRHVRAVNSSIARSRIDWLIGMNLSTAYTVRYGELVRYGSVKSPTLLMIYKNDQKIKNYKETIHYGVRSTYKSGTEFSGVLINEDDNKEKVFETKPEAEALAATLSSEATVVDFVKKTVAHKAPKLYALSDLQVDASKIGYQPDRVLDIAQKLYEERKILTYPRTSGRYLSSGKTKDFPMLLKSIGQIPELAPYISKISAADIAKASGDANMVNDKEVAKSSHDALTPTGAAVDWDALTKPEQDIFLLVCKRFLAHFMPIYVEEKVTAILENRGNKFRANGRRTVDNGFNCLYGTKTEDVILPPLSKGDKIPVLSSEPYEKKSSPPTRYTTGSIIQAMISIGNQIEDSNLKKLMKESEGIGTEATRAEILKELQNSGYISVSKNTIYITDAGIRYIDHIRNVHPDGSVDYGIADPEQVAFWSAKNKEIQLGEIQLDEVMNRFNQYLEKKIRELKSTGDPVKRAPGETADTQDMPPCPKCGGKIVRKRTGFSCCNYGDGGCKFFLPDVFLEKKLLVGQQKALLNGSTLHMKGFKSKAGKTFEADVKLNPETGYLELSFDKNPKRYGKKEDK